MFVLVCVFVDAKVHAVGTLTIGLGLGLKKLPLCTRLKRAYGGRERAKERDRTETEKAREGGVREKILPSLCPFF